MKLAVASCVIAAVPSISAQTYPLLSYNCAKLPAICRNIRIYYTSAGYQQANPAVAPPHTFQGDILTDSVILHYYGPNSPNRDVVCTSSWKANHPCPETNQPLTVARGSSLSSGGFVGQPFIPGQNIIADPMGNFTGMAWSCEEWPPSFSQEGGSDGTRPPNLIGRGLPISSTFCAPFQANRIMITNAGLGTTYTGQQTEQTLQGKAHGSVARGLAAGAPFTFDEFFVDAPAAAAAAVTKYINGVLDIDVIVKRTDGRIEHDGPITRRFRDLDLRGRKPHNDSYLVHEHRFDHNDTVVAQRVYFVRPDEGISVILPGQRQHARALW